jgi:hypothetical protein
LLKRIKANPDLPLALRCNLDDQFAFQSPGHADDTREGPEFNQKRDLDVLQRLGLTPGTVLPARILLGRIFQAISSVTGICGYPTVTAPAWRGCTLAGTGRFERGRAQGLDAILPPRGRAELQKSKAASLKALGRARAIRIRPHILLCAVAQYGRGVRPPYDPDNLPEMLQLIIRRPNTPVTLVPSADWMMCASCPKLVPSSGICVHGLIGIGGLYNEKKDLNVLQALGLTYGVTLPARKLYKLIFERIPKTAGICALLGRTTSNSLWNDECGNRPDPCPDYEKGRELLMKELGGFQR